MGSSGLRIPVPHFSVSGYIMYIYKTGTDRYVLQVHR